MSSDASQSLVEASRSPESYTIGIICALSIEKAAVEAMLDKKHPALPQPSKDENKYTFGEIGPHNAVVACLPSNLYGKASAARVAQDMKRSFPIRLGLMVGIGGGVWSQEYDIRLGDVVVSQPEGVHGGVVQYDFGKNEAGRGFQLKGHLNSPPFELLSALSELKSRHIMEDDCLPQYLEELGRKFPKMIKSSGYKHQGSVNDKLFRASYIHPAGQRTCDECGTRSDQIVARPDRPDTKPLIHYGTIASADQVMKNGLKRDDIVKAEGVICFEMEAAGLMNRFPCLVIRGISDYADSHKNDSWQPYAAATAAAYAKELLGVINPTAVSELPTIGK
ncbi:hypothetical protein M8818_003910 [Zalaria obscura]|uniref:Uncharacterized protein n=1 Tax=Zalaria obscura TaxID=2024903 RepID=A0ACC3SDG3_9PEZI